MRSNPFYFEIKDVITQFIGAFNDIVINRHDKYRQSRSKVKVRYVYAPKQRVIHDLTNKARHITLPVVAVNITSIDRDESRVFNKIYGAYLSEHERNPVFANDSRSTTSYHVPQPVPISVDVNMSILARYQTDIEQIISNFIPYSDPYIIISWKMPEEFYSKDVEIRSEVLWNGGVSMDYPENISSTDPYRLSCDTSFTIKTWLFKKAPEKPISNIYKITSNTTQVVDFNLDIPYHDDTTQTSLVQSVGPPLTAAPYITHVDDYGKNRNILGYNMLSTTNAYVSSVQMNQLSGSEIDIHGDRQISNLFPAFTAVEIPFEIMNDNMISVDLSSVTQEQSVDIILTNAGGYSTAATSPHHGKLITISNN